jgi:hypothetical protein
MPFKNITHLDVRRRRPSHEYIEFHLSLESVSEDPAPKENFTHQVTSPLTTTKSLKLHLDDVPFEDRNFTRLGSLELAPSIRCIQLMGTASTPARRLREKLSSFIDAAHAAGQPCAAPWNDLDHRQLPPPQSTLQIPRSQPDSPQSKCAAAAGSFRTRGAPDGKQACDRSMSESNLMQDMAWQRLISVGFETPPPPAAVGSFLPRRNTGSRSRRSSAKSAASESANWQPPLAATTAAAARSAAAPMAAASPPPPLGPPPACCSAADTAAAESPSPDGESPDGEFAAGAGGVTGRMRFTDKAVFRAQVAAALGKGRAVWL